MLISTRDRTYRRWRIPLIGKGSIGDRGGHHRVFGITYAWIVDFPPGWAPERSLNFWGLIKVAHQDTDGGRLKAVRPGWSVKWCRLRLGFNRVY